MPDFETLAVAVDHAVDSAVGLLVLDRPERLNAISTRMVEEILAATEWFDAQPNVRAVVVSGAGRCFSAGADIDEFRGRFDGGVTEQDRAEALEEARRGRAMTDAVERMRAVTVAAVRGPAYGGAVALLAACDLRVVADDTRIVVPEVAMGLPLAWGGVERLVRELGPATARNLLLTARPMGPTEAVARGFAVSQHPVDDLLDAAHALASAIASRPQYGTSVLRQRIRAVVESDSAPDDDSAALAAALCDADVLAAGSAYLAALDPDRTS